MQSKSACIFLNTIIFFIFSPVLVRAENAFQTTVSLFSPCPVPHIRIRVVHATEFSSRPGSSNARSPDPIALSHFWIETPGGTWGWERKEESELVACYLASPLGIILFRSSPFLSPFSMTFTSFDSGNDRNPRNAKGSIAPTVYS